MSMQRAYSDLNLHDTRDLLKLLGDNKTVLTIFSNSNLPFSYAIRCKTNSKWSHCAFILPDGNIIESSATRGGVVIDTLDNFKHRAKEWAIADYYCENPQLAYAYFLSQKGKKYDFTGLVGYAIKNRDFQEDDAWFCSEIGETSFVKGGSPHFKCKRSNVSPKDLWQHKRSVLLTSYA